MHGNFKAWNTSELTKKGMAEKKARGEVYGNIPFGFKAKGGKMVKCPKEQAVIKLVKKLRGTGMSFRKIGRHLEELGYKNRRGSTTWHHEGLKRMLAES